MRRHFLPIILTIALSALVSTGIIYLVKNESELYKYEIVDGNRQHYKTKAYTKNADGCITFQKECGCGGEELETVVLCGTYTIEENKDYNPSAQ